MSKEKETVKLNDEQLGQVSGGKEQVKSEPTDIIQHLCAKGLDVLIKWNTATATCLSPNSNNDTCKNCTFNPNSTINNDNDPYGGKYDPI